jgi:hypothetical protein
MFVKMDPEVEQSPLPAYTEFPAETSHKILGKPIVVPRKCNLPESYQRVFLIFSVEQTNLFMIKSFSPFARSYSPALEKLPNPVSREQFLSFIDGLNNAFLSSPIFQAAHVVGGGLLSSQILPAQAVGGVVQITSVLGSASVTMIRVRKYMKTTNETIFAPRGLVAKIMNTKKMMAAINFTNTDQKGKLALPPLDELEDLTPPSTLALDNSGSDGPLDENAEAANVEDPRLRRLRALEGFVAPLELETTPAPTKGAMDKYGGAPLRWLNKKQDSKLQKAASKSTESRLKNASAAEAEFKQTEAEIESIEYRMQELRLSAERELVDRPEAKDEIEAKMESELAILEQCREAEVKRRDEKVKEVYKKGDKKLEKLAKKEEKIANRILWIVIMRKDGSVDDELLEVGSIES